MAMGSFDTLWAKWWSEMTTPATILGQWSWPTGAHLVYLFIIVLSEIHWLDEQEQWQKQLHFLTCTLWNHLSNKWTPQINLMLTCGCVCWECNASLTVSELGRCGQPSSWMGGALSTKVASVGINVVHALTMEVGLWFMTFLKSGSLTCIAGVINNDRGWLVQSCSVEPEWDWKEH